MTASSPLVYVIIPTHNRKEMCREAVQSVLAQRTSARLVVVVVDDGGKDGTGDHLADLDVVVLRHDTPKHASAARNTGIEAGVAAGADYFAFVDDDDLWTETKLQEQLDDLASHPDHDMSSCWMSWFDETGAEIHVAKPAHQGNLFDLCLVTQPIGNTSTLLVSARAMAKVQGFDPAIPRGNDDDFIRRVAEHFLIRVVPRPLVRYRVGHADRITALHRDQYQKRIDAEKRKLERFDYAYAARPGARSVVYSKIARWYGAMGQRREGVRWARRAIQADRGHLSGYKALLRVMQGKE